MSGMGFLTVFVIGIIIYGLVDRICDYLIAVKAYDQKVGHREISSGVNDWHIEETYEEIPERWLFRVFNGGWPKDSPKGDNAWSAWDECSFEDAIRLADADRHDCYEFVPLIPGDPRDCKPMETE